ncbi:MAG: hypothetical protein MZV64_70885 [Ignavibacteriales bacterium]|nr:hypothetical protein [Ignavibacteriales bacterium]
MLDPARHPVRAEPAPHRLPRDHPHPAGPLHQLLRGRDQERRLSRLQADRGGERPRIERPDGGSGGAAHGPGDAVHLLRLRLLRHGQGRVRAAAGEHGPRARRRDGDLPLSAFRQGARATGQGGLRERSCRDNTLDLGLHQGRPLQRFLGPLDEDGDSRRSHQGDGGEGEADPRDHR